MSDGDGQQQIDFQPEDQKPQLSSQKTISVGNKPGTAGAIDFQEETPAAPISDAPPEPDTMSKIGSTLRDVGTGAVKGLGNTVSGVSSLINKIPGVGETLAPKQGITALHGMTRPQGTAQNVGYYGEQAAEMLTPGLGEEGAAEKAATLVPRFAEYARPAARIATNALETGGLNKLQGGSFKGGLAAGGAFGALGEAGRAVAPSLAEGALSVTKKMRGFGKTPGRAILDETSAVSPGKIAVQAEKKIRSLTGELENRAAASTVAASTNPALDVINRAKTKAIMQNDRSTYEMLNGLSDQLTKEFSTGNPIPSEVPASKILDLKRGIGNLEKNWNPELRSGMRPVIRKVYGALDKELDRSVPGAGELNQKISSLIPASQRAKSTELGADLPQRLGHRLAAHTGALTSAVSGGLLGYREGGTPGALIGGTAGLVVPELLSSPRAQMGLARAAASPKTAKIARAAVLPLRRRLNDNDEPED